MRLSATSLIRLVTVVVEKTVQLVMSVADFFFVYFFGCACSTLFFVAQLVCVACNSVMSAFYSEWKRKGTFRFFSYLEPNVAFNY